MKKLGMTVVLATVFCLAGAWALLTSYAQQAPTVKMAADKSGAGKLYRQNCARCHGAGGEGSDVCCMMMSGPNLLSAVLRMDAKAFLAEVRHVGETNMCAGNLLDLSSAEVEAIRNYLLEVSKQAKAN
jgi:mono/diheme cytochrome c family protein